MWKDIKGYEGKYQISNKGKVKSLRLNNNKKFFKGILKEFPSKKGRCVYLNSNDKPTVRFYIDIEINAYF